MLAPWGPRGARMARRRDEAVSHDPWTRYSESKPTKLDHGQPGCRVDRRPGIRQTEPSSVASPRRLFPRLLYLTSRFDFSPRLLSQTSLPDSSPDLPIRLLSRTSSHHGASPDLCHELLLRLLLASGLAACLVPQEAHRVPEPVPLALRKWWAEDSFDPFP